MSGGAGVDRFEGSATDFKGDRITDYTASEKIYLYQNLASATQVNLVAAANGTDTELRIDTDNDTVFETAIRSCW